MKFEIKPPPYRSAQIVDRAVQLIEEYCSIVGRSTLLLRGLRFDDVFAQVIYPKYEIELDETQDLGFDDAGKKILVRLQVLILG